MGTFSDLISGAFGAGPNADAGAITDAKIQTDISRCQADNPCEAAWQSSYAYAADQAYNLAVFQALQGVVFGALQYASADRTADLQYDIANRQMVIAEEEYERYKSVYVECEDNVAREICALTVPEVNYATHANRAQRDVRREYTLRRRKAERNRGKYCMADFNRTLCDIDRDEALAVVQARDMAYRYAEKRQDYFENQRWDRRVTILQHGRNIFNGQSSVYQSGMSAAATALNAEQGALDNFLGTLSGGIGTIANARYAQNLSNNRTQGQPSAGGMINGGAPSAGGMTGSSLQSGVRAF